MCTEGMLSLVVSLCPAWHRHVFAHGQPLPDFEGAKEQEYRTVAHGEWRGNDRHKFVQ